MLFVFSLVKARVWINMSLRVTYRQSTRNYWVFGVFTRSVVSSVKKSHKVRVTVDKKHFFNKCRCCGQSLSLDMGWAEARSSSTSSETHYCWGNTSNSVLWTTYIAYMSSTSSDLAFFFTFHLQLKLWGQFSNTKNNHSRTMSRKTIYEVWNLQYLHIFFKNQNTV